MTLEVTFQVSQVLHEALKFFDHSGRQIVLHRDIKEKGVKINIAH